MIRSGKKLISAADSPYSYGESFDFERRHGCIPGRIKQLASVFCIDITAYAIMSSH